MGVGKLTVLFGLALIGVTVFAFMNYDNHGPGLVVGIVVGFALVMAAGIPLSTRLAGPVPLRDDRGPTLDVESRHGD